jgi:hypothetical protein
MASRKHNRPPSAADIQREQEKARRRNKQAAEAARSRSAPPSKLERSADVIGDAVDGTEAVGCLWEFIKCIADLLSP